MYTFQLKKDLPFYSSLGLTIHIALRHPSTGRDLLVGSTASHFEK